MLNKRVLSIFISLCLLLALLPCASVFAAQEATPAELAALQDLQACDIAGWSESAIIEKIAPLFTEDQKNSGILASVSLAQFMLESACGQSELAQQANNCFGMKTVLSANTWEGSVWDGVSSYTKQTQEDDGTGTLYTITAGFRSYPSIAMSLADHSAYLLGAESDSGLRYPGLSGCTDYTEAIRIIRDGGYATDTSYVSKICSLIVRYNLTQYDLANITPAPGSEKETTGSYPGSFRIDIAGDRVAYRNSPSGITGAVIGRTGSGTFTVSEVEDDWGLLAETDGWVDLSDPSIRLHQTK